MTRGSAKITARSSQPSEIELAQASPAGFLFHVKRETAEPWIPYRMHLLIDHYLTEVAAGRIKLLALQVPVQSGKTLLASVGNSVWTLGRFPGKTVAAFSYTTDFAVDKIGRPARNLMEQFGPSIFGLGVDPRSNAAFRWDLVDAGTGRQTGGGFYCGGVDAGLAGRKIDLAIIDDPIGLASDAENPRVREAVWQWYQRDLRQRLNPGSAVIWIMSRWDPDDPVGRLIKHTLANNIPMTLVDLPAIALDPAVDEAPDAAARRELQLPVEPYRDVLDRAPGEPLCPQLRPLDFLLAQKRSAGSRVFAANYQGRPMASGGTIYRKEWFRDATLESGILRLLTRAGDPVEVVPLRACRLYAMCDPATGKAAQSPQHAQRLAFFVIGVAAMTPKYNVVILDILRNKDPGTEQLGHLFSICRKWSVERVGVEDVGYQSTLIQYAVQRGLPCVPIKRGRESKESRGRFAAARYEAGTVYHRRTAEPWRVELESELETFPAGFKDQADVIADCVSVVAIAAQSNDQRAFGARILRQPERGVAIW